MYDESEHLFLGASEIRADIKVLSSGALADSKRISQSL
jgi:hypothetical protein